METICMRYGEGEVAFAIAGARWVRTLQAEGLPPVQDIESALRRALGEESIGISFQEAFTPGDKVTIVISDITRFWMRQDMVCRILVDMLGEMGIAPEDIVVLVALGTHRPQTAAELEKIASPEVYRRVKVLNHDCDAADLVHVGTTGRATAVRVNPLAVGRKVILVGGTVHHLMSGYGGGRKSIVPGISGRETVYQNHLHSLDPNAPRSNPLIGMGLLENNPVHEDMMEAAALVKPAYGVNVVMGNGGHGMFCCGHWHDAWLESTRAVHRANGLKINKQADIVIASCGGFPRDIDLYQGTKSLLNAAQAVRPGGTLLFLAECREGGGNPQFFGWIDALRRGRLDTELRADFNIAGYIFYAACEAIARAKTYMLSAIPAETVRDMHIKASGDITSLLSQIDFTDKSVYLMPEAGSTMPYVR